MAMGTGLLALAILGADAPSCSTEETVNFQVRVLTLDGLDWRTSSYTRLQPVARRGTTMIWTADKALAAQLAERATRPSSPPVRMMTIGEAVMVKSETIHYIAAMDRVANGPFNQSTAIAYIPRPEQVDERLAIKLSGRKIDQGVLSKIAIEETHVDVIHKVTQGESLKPSNPKTSRTPAEVGTEILNVVMAPQAAPQPQTIGAQIQIPEVSRCNVEGEWLIPTDGVLMVSLGVKTAADDQGKAVVRERVAVIEASVGSTVIPAIRQAAFEAGEPVPFAVSNLVAPAVPSRSMPQAVDPDGTINDLPPLPEAVASADLDRIKPDPNQPSPQAPMISAPEPDNALVRTGFDAAPPAPMVAVEAAPGRSMSLTKILAELVKSGVNVDVDLDVRDLAALKAACEQCDGDSTFCPANSRAIFPGGKVAGGFQPAMDLPVGLANQVRSVADLMKNPGKTETTIVPLGGNFTLELKATVVPNTADKSKTATRTGDAFPTQR